VNGGNADFVEFDQCLSQNTHAVAVIRIQELGEMLVRRLGYTLQAIECIADLFTDPVMKFGRRGIRECDYE
jgi:hypothetical protein